MTVTRGQKIAYVTDVADTVTNRAALYRGDFCASRFGLGVRTQPLDDGGGG